MDISVISDIKQTTKDPVSRSLLNDHMYKASKAKDSEINGIKLQYRHEIHCQRHENKTNFNYRIFGNSGTPKHVSENTVSLFPKIRYVQLPVGWYKRGVLHRVVGASM